MLIPRCPKCGDCKILLAPISGKTEQTHYQVKIDAAMPVACSQCDWKGDWKDVPYLS